MSLHPVGSCLLQMRRGKSNGWPARNTLTNCHMYATSHAKRLIVFMRINGKWLLCDDEEIRPVVIPTKSWPCWPNPITTKSNSRPECDLWESPHARKNSSLD